MTWIIEIGLALGFSVAFGGILCWIIYETVRDVLKKYFK